MVARDTAWPPGTPCWVDLGVDDIGKAGAFYSGLFGWDVRYGGAEVGGYSMCLKNGRAVAGIGPKQGPPGTPSAWTVYLASGNVDETASAIIAAGGQVFTGPVDVMEAGRMAVAADPGGAVFGLWQSGEHTGFGVADEPGAVVWNENFSRDFDGNKGFYHAVFGYEYGDVEGAGLRYATLKLGGREVGGIGEMNGGHFEAGTPAHWSVYFGVDDTDAAVKAVTDAAGSLVRPPWNTPYGRMAVVSDDQGAVFELLSISPASPAGGP